MTLRIAVPDGALRAPSLRILAAAGATGGDAGRERRRRAGSRRRHHAARRRRRAPVSASGAADAGLAAKDLLLERSTGLCELLDLRFGDALLVYAAAPGAAARAERLGRLRIATRHPALTRSYFAARGVEVAVVEVVGALDRAVADGVADGVVALVETPPAGAAPAGVAGLAVEGTVAASSVRLVAGRGARVLRTAELGTLVARLRELIAAKPTA